MTTFRARLQSWQFPRAFWTANVVELFERAAYYGMFIAPILYLTNVVGFSDINAAWIGGVYAGGLYLLSPFSGARADTMGFTVSGYLHHAYCPDPRTLSADQLVHAYDNAHYIRFSFAGIGVEATVALIVYGRFTSK